MSAVMKSENLFANDVEEIAYYIARGQLALPARMKGELRAMLCQAGFVFSARSIGQKHHAVVAVEFPLGWKIESHSARDYGRRMYLVDKHRNRRAVVRICNNTTNYRTDMRAFLYHGYRLFDCTSEGRFLNVGESRENCKRGMFLTIKGRPSTPIGVVDSPNNLQTLLEMAQRALDKRYPEWRDPASYW